MDTSFKYTPDNISSDTMLDYVFRLLPAKEEEAFEDFLDGNEEYAQAVDEIMKVCIAKKLEDKSSYVAFFEQEKKGELAKFKAKLGLLDERRPELLQPSRIWFLNGSRRWLAAASVVLLAGLCGWLIFKETKHSQRTAGLQSEINSLSRRAEELQNKTLVFEQEKNILVDSLDKKAEELHSAFSQIKNDSARISSLEERLRRIEKQSPSVFDGPSMAYAFHEPLPIGTSKSGNSWQQLYLDRDYGAALAALQKLRDNDKPLTSYEKAELDLFIGSCLIFENRYSEAIGILSKLSKDKNADLLADEVDWHLALAYVLAKKPDKAKPLLEGLKVYPRFSAKAEKLLKKLK